MTRHMDLLAGLSEQDAAQVRALGSPVSLPAGAVVFRLGNEATSLYLVESGLVTLTMPMQVGGHEEEVCVDERIQGQALGWSTLIPPYRFTLNAAVPVATDLIELPRERLLAYFEIRPDVGCRVSQNVAALVGQRLQVFQAMWLRQMQHLVNYAHV
jgi:CRP/FNR family transcriptional regulator, cyclic AMP receptor protein